jgi:hypothetical protein
LLNYLVKYTNFNFELKDRWGKTPLDEISDPKIRAEYQAIVTASRNHHQLQKK